MNTHPHELAALLAALGRAGIELAPHPTDPARLRHRPAALPADLSARLRLHREAILRLLASGYAPDPHAADSDAAYVCAERLGVADGLDLATHPGSPAWLIAVGESMEHSCQSATSVVHFGHGTIDGRDSRSDQGQRSNALRDRQGRGRGPQSTVAAAER